MQNAFRQTESTTSHRTLLYYHVVITIVILALSSIGSIALGKDGNWDLLNYHFYNPAALLTGRIGFDVFPAQRQNWLNPLMDIPTYLMIMNLKPWLVGVLIGMFHGLNLVFVYHIAQRIFQFLSPFKNALLATLITTLAATGSIVRGLWGAFTGDLTVSVFVLAALLMFLSALAAPPGKTRMRNYVVSGLIMGFGTGLRTTVAVHAIPLLLLSLMLGTTSSARLRTFIAYGAACAIGFTLSYGYWALFLFSHYGSPFFPYYNAIFRSPLIAHTNLVDLRWMPASFIDHLKLPLRYVRGVVQSDVDFRDFRAGYVSVALLLLGLSLVWRIVRRNDKGLLVWEKAKPIFVLILFTVISWAIWQVEFSYYRYLAPLELIFPVLFFSAAYLIIPRLRIVVGVSCVIFAVLIISTVPITYARGEWGDNYFNVQISSGLHLADAQVLIVDRDRPLAFMAPFFPRSTQVLRLTSNMEEALHDPTHSALQAWRINETHQPRPKYVMYSDLVRADELVEIDRVLAQYGLRQDKSRCGAVTSSFSNVTLCAVRDLTRLALL